MIRPAPMPAPDDTGTATDRRPRGTIRALPFALIVAALLLLGTAVAVIVRHANQPAAVDAHPRPPLLPAGAVPTPLTVTASDGRLIRCPTGSMPAVMLTNGSFVPPLKRGTTMEKAHYHLRFTGTVTNETNDAVVIRSLTVTVRGVPWNARIDVAHTIAPQSSARLVIDGRYHSTEPGGVDVRTQFDWNWQSADLADCGGVGLVEDD
jgi:hypothetical protein